MNQRHNKIFIDRAYAHQAPYLNSPQSRARRTGKMTGLSDPRNYPPNRILLWISIVILTIAVIGLSVATWYETDSRKRPHSYSAERSNHSLVNAPAEGPFDPH